MNDNRIQSIDRALRLTAAAISRIGCKASLPAGLPKAIGIAALVLWAALAGGPAGADSSSPLLAAYYDRQMAIVGGQGYYWTGNNQPERLPFEVVQTGVGRDRYYALTRAGGLLRFGRDPQRHRVLMTGVARFAAGGSGVLAITKDGVLWWIAAGSSARRKIASGVVAAAVGDGANYYITSANELYVRGKAHRGQYGDGRLEATDHFVRTAGDVKQITAHTGHAIVLTRGGDVMGTGGNIYGPVGRHGLGDKAVRWSLIVSRARAIATGASHSLAIRPDGTLLAWGRRYGPEPVPVLAGVAAVAAGSQTTIALKSDGSLWQWDRGERPRPVKLE
ncbi:MAG: hypothetical protein HKN11_14935 [Rhizobiales bacterium]|nr:hypothetical protein [Hyphomicrobiales bacterium]